ncbi:RDD family protein [Dyella acidiphila]|uniref:RDD family protein n=1 Tax=Dyella acidiphila TaxID=2775866 RepID=A0ABR9G901_9GAMM|nr:RDD family protein [Dyella acidiphila]MBE1160515.1 RDD family protein [Dyella acidiphila]
MREEWYVELDGAAHGPHQRQSVLALRGAGRLNTDTLVWREGLPDWIRYAEAGLEQPPLPPVLPNPPVVPERGYTALDTLDDAAAHAPKLDVEDDGWQWTGPSPWRRYLARSLDMFLLGGITWLAVLLTAAVANKAMFETVFTHRGLMGFPVFASMAVMASLIPAQALLVGLSGTTIGKWIFGIRITRRDGSAIGMRAALVRELSVYGLGTACGIPFLAFIPLIIAYHVLMRTGTTQWDRGQDWVVTQRAPGERQNAMFVLGLLLLITLVNLLRHVGAALQ